MPSDPSPEGQSALSATGVRIDISTAEAERPSP